MARQHALGNVGEVRKTIDRWCHATEAGVEELKASVKELHDGNASRLIAFDASYDQGSPEPRTDAECLLLAIFEIRALERHERRALSRRRRAIRIFDALNACA
jgi:hypothetical protein